MVDYIKPIAESNRFIVLDKYIEEWKVYESDQSEGDLEREQSKPSTHKEGALCPSI